MAAKKVSFGISLEPTLSIPTSIELATLSEKFGFSTIWVPDGGPAPPYSDSIVTLSAIASKTKKIRIGSAILNFYTRNPAQIASSFLALSDLASSGRSPQRAILGIGIGSAYNVSKLGIQDRSGMTSDLREAIESIRELFQGKQVTVRTDSFAIENVALSKAVKKIPIHVGASGPKSLRLAGEIADGVILTDRIPSDIEESMKPITMGLAEGSRRRKDLEVTNSVVISVDENAEKAMNSARVTCAYLVAWLDDERAESLGFNMDSKRRIAQFLGSGDDASAAKLVERKMLSALAVCGRPDDCIDRIREHIAYGVDHIAFCEPFGPKISHGIALIAKQIIPKL